MQQTESTRPKLLLVDDDDTFCRVLATALQRRGYDVSVAQDSALATQLIEQIRPEFAVLDLRLIDGSGLKLVSLLRAVNNKACIVVLTGYGSISTAIDAIKLGATHYLTKPANTDQIVAAFGAAMPDPDTQPEVQQLQSVNRLEWEHIQRVLHDVGGNISEAARALHMHRRTLQRKLSKRAPRE